MIHDFIVDDLLFRDAKFLEKELRAETGHYLRVHGVHMEKERDHKIGFCEPGEDARYEFFRIEKEGEIYGCLFIHDITELVSEPPVVFVESTPNLISVGCMEYVKSELGGEEYAETLAEVSKYLLSQDLYYQDGTRLRHTKLITMVPSKSGPARPWGSRMGLAELMIERGIELETEEAEDDYLHGSGSIDYILSASLDS